MYTITRLKKIKDKMPDISNLATNASLNGKINEVKGEVPTNTNLATIAALTIVENKIPKVTNLVKKLTIMQTSMKLKRKLLSSSWFNTTGTASLKHLLWFLLIELMVGVLLFI